MESRLGILEDDDKRSTCAENLVQWMISAEVPLLSNKHVVN